MQNKGCNLNFAPIKKVFFVVFLPFSVFVLLYLVTSFFQIYNKPIQSKNLLIEGWVSSIVIEKAAQYSIKNDIDSIFIVNMKDKNVNDTNSWSENYKRKEVKEW